MTQWMSSGPGSSLMSKPRMAYFEEEDMLHLTISEGPEAQSVELSPNITVELNNKGELIGIEILDASEFLRNMIAESAQMKLLGAPRAESGWGENRSIDRPCPRGS